MAPMDVSSPPSPLEPVLDTQKSGGMSPSTKAAQQPTSSRPSSVSGSPGPQQAEPAAQTSQAAVPSAQQAHTQRQPDDESIDPLDPRPVSPRSDPVVAVAPGHHVTIVDNRNTNSAVVVNNAASVSSGSGSANAPSQQQKPAPLQAALPPKKASKSGFWHILAVWMLELFACLLAILMLVTEIVLLWWYDNRSITIWSHTWNINSVFAFLTAILEAGVAFAVTACLGQLRWLWFQKGNQELRWMDRLTNARAAPGALHLVLNPAAWRHWAFLGALLIVSLLGASVFTQQIINQHSKEETVDPSISTCSVPISNTYDGDWQFGNTNGNELPYVAMMASIQSGFFLPSAVEGLDTVVNLVDCGTGNCTFKEYSSLAVCSKCADISDTIVIPCDQDDCASTEANRLYLPDHSLTLDPILGYVNITSDTLYPNASLLPDVGPLIAHYKGLGSVDFPNTAPYATECAIWWCVQTYNATVVASIFNENVIETSTNLSASARTTYGDGNGILLRPETCYLNGTKTSPNSTDCTYSADATSHLALQNYLVGDSNTTGFLSGDVVNLNANGSGWLYTSIAANALIAPCTIGDGSDCTNAFYSNLEASIQNMTYYMTNNLRKTVDLGPGFTFGTMTTSQTFFHVRWGWLAYPIAIVLISVIFVLVTMVKSRHTEPWKSSVVALMFHGFHDADRVAYHRLDDPKEMEAAQRKWSVSLVNLDGTKTFVKAGTVVEGGLGKWDHASEKPTGWVTTVGESMIEAYGQSS